MKRLITFGKKLAFSQTAKDTYLVMTANVANGLTGLILSVLIARSLSVADFGIFSSLLNVVLILMAFIDLGMTQGVVNFVSMFLVKRQPKKISWYTGTMISIMLLVGAGVILLLQVIPSQIMEKIAGTSNRAYLLLAGFAVITLNLYPYLLGVFQAFRKFVERTIIEVVFDSLRIGFLVLLIVTGLTVGKAVLAYVLGAVIIFFLIWRLLPVKPINFNLSLRRFKKIFVFSRWLWAVSLIINVYGRMDVLLLTALTSSFVVGEYAAAARLALVFPMVTGALNAVVAPRFASFGDKKADFSYLRKTLLLCSGVACGLLTFALIAKPLILGVYGDRYEASIGIFRLLVLVNFPLLLTIPATNSLVYFYKKPSLITGISLLQLVIMAGLTLWFIPRLTAYAPVFGFLVANLAGLLLVYVFWLKCYFRVKYDS